MTNNILFAHAFGQRYDLPIPLLLFVLSGAGVVFLSFILVIRQKVQPNKYKKSVDTTHVGGFNWMAVMVSIIVLVALTLAGLLGSQTIAENILPTIFWLIVWIAVPLSCGLLGDWTQLVNPFANISKMADKKALRKLVLNREQPLAWPSSLGWWLASIIFFALACGELIFNQTATKPAFIASAFVLYAVANIVMSIIFSKEWLKKGEVFTVLFSTWGRLGFFRFGADGKKGFTGGLVVPFEHVASRITFILLLLVSVSFDGLLATPSWTKFIHILPPALAPGTLLLRLFTVIVFIVLALLTWGMFSAFAIGVAKAGRLLLRPPQALAGLLPSMLPIAFGYLLAHNLQYLITNVQLLFPLIGNPIGKDSWPIHLRHPFNDSFEPNLHVFSTAFYWYVAVAVIVVVHILAVIIAHQHLGSTNKSEVHAKRSEYPWVFAMVLYTMLSLWLLAQPLVKEDSKSTGYVQPTNSLNSLVVGLNYSRKSS